MTMDMVDELDPTVAEKLAYAAGYKQGLFDGVRRFAWWKNGTQYVGTGGNTLSEAYITINRECEDPNYKQPY